MTSVIHIRDAPPHFHGNPDYVFIGRPSKWGNPFHVSMGRERCILQYEIHVRSNRHLMDSLHELKGKTLVCYCKPQDCHGDVLVTLVEAL